MKKTKKIILSSLTAGLLMSACAAVGVMSVNDTAKANAASLPVTGTATEAVTAEQALTSFTMEDAAGVRTATPNGIRFETSISAADLATLPNTAEFGTLIIPKDVLGAGTLDINNANALNIKANVWRSKSTAETFVYSGVLIGESAQADFPEAEYATDLVAVSYVTYSYTAADAEEATTVTKYSTAVTRNMAYVAASALYDAEKPNPDTNGVLANILKKSVTSVEVAESMTMVAGNTANYAVSTNVESALAIPAKIEVTGDAVTYENGVLTAVKAGTATVTATIGNVSDTTTVKVYAEVVDKGNVYELNDAYKVAQYETATLSVTAEDLGLTDETIVSAYNAATKEAYAVSEGVVSYVSGAGYANATNIVFLTENGAYQAKVIGGTYLISTPDQLNDYMADINGVRLAGGHGLVTQDIRFPDDWVNPRFPSRGNRVIAYGTNGYANGGYWTLDGCGHIVSNFTMWEFYGTSYTSSGWNKRGVVTNIGFDVAQDLALSGIENAGSAMCPQNSNGMYLSNVWMNITVTASDIAAIGGTWGIFGNGAQNCPIYNVVVNVNVVGDATGMTIYSGITGTMNVGAANELSNVYVKCNAKTTQQPNYGFDKVQVIKNPSDIGTIAGSFEVKDDGNLYWNGNMVMAYVEEVLDVGNVYVLNDAYKVALYETATLSVTAEDLGVTGTITEAVNMASGAAYTVTEGVASIPMAAGYADAQVVVFTTTTGKCQAKIIGGTYLINNADDLAKFMANIDNVRLEGGHGLVTKDIAVADDWKNPINEAWGNKIIACGPSGYANSGYWWLDGCGHVVSNFTMWEFYGTWYQFSAWNKRGVVANIGFDVKQELELSGIENAGGVLCAQSANGMYFRNVWMNITVEASQIAAIGGTWGIFGNGAQGCPIYNVVVNVNVIGDPTGLTIYNGITGSMNVGEANELNGVYVKCNAPMTAQPNYGFANSVAVTSASEVGSFLAQYHNFTKEADGLYWNGHKVMD